MNLSTQTDLRDREGTPINLSLPLSFKAFEQLDGLVLSSRLEREQREQVKRVLQSHFALVERDPKASPGNDLNNFWVLHEYTERYISESRTPLELGEKHEQGFSSKYLSEPLSIFADAIKNAYATLGIEPRELKREIEIASYTGDSFEEPMKKLAQVYVCLRNQGYNHIELIQ